jgi:hypothetical protein
MMDWNGVDGWKFNHIFRDQSRFAFGSGLMRAVNVFTIFNLSLMILRARSDHAGNSKKLSGAPRN